MYSVLWEGEDPEQCLIVSRVGSEAVASRKEGHHHVRWQVARGEGMSWG